MCFGQLKKEGMRWSESGLNHLLHLRLAWTSERLESLFALTFPIGAVPTLSQHCTLAPLEDACARKRP